MHLYKQVYANTCLVAYDNGCVCHCGRNQSRPVQQNSTASFNSTNCGFSQVIHNRSKTSENKTKKNMVERWWCSADLHYQLKYRRAYTFEYTSVTWEDSSLINFLFVYTQGIHNSRSFSLSSCDANCGLTFQCDSRLLGHIHYTTGSLPLQSVE